MSSSVHVPMPVSRSVVMLAAVALKAGVVKERPPPARSLPRTGVPSTILGVWQLPQARMVVTRYRPRSSGVSADADPAVRPAMTIAAASDRAQVSDGPSDIGGSSGSLLSG